jgi:hypothetical protein
MVDEWSRRLGERRQPSRGGVVGRNQDFKTVALTEVNAHIRELADESPSHDLKWEFFCECGHRDCKAQLVLSIEEYTSIRDRDEAVLAPGHLVNQSARSRRLREEAQALRAQAAHQLRRAKRIEALREEAAHASLRNGARVWVNGSRATFREHVSGGRQAARVHLDGESGTRVIPLSHLRTAPPRRG